MWKGCPGCSVYGSGSSVGIWVVLLLAPGVAQNKGLLFLLLRPPPGTADDDEFT